MESETTDMIVENVKIDKIIFVETYTCEEWLRLFRDAIVIVERTGRNLFVLISVTKKKNSNMKINEH
jgi:hypothetical protein